MQRVRVLLRQDLQVQVEVQVQVMWLRNHPILDLSSLQYVGMNQCMLGCTKWVIIHGYIYPSTN